MPELEIYLKCFDLILPGEEITEIFLTRVILPSKGLLDFTFKMQLALHASFIFWHYYIENRKREN